jgi:hypothetical protein
LVAPRILVLDIETSPNLVYTWGLFRQNIGINQIVKPTEIICFSAKWLGGKMQFCSSYDYSLEKITEESKHNMVAVLWTLLDQADAIIHYNGQSFDIPHINREFLQQDMTPPSPYAQIDLYRTVRSRFRHASNKLDWVAQELGIGSKTTHEGFGLWERCLQGDPLAWARMERYNRQDVKLTEALYRRLLPWITNHPALNLITGTEHSCPVCSSLDLTKRGLAHTKTSTFQQWQCNECGSYSRSGKRLSGVDLRQVGK